MNFRQTGILLGAVFAVGLGLTLYIAFTDDTAPDTQFLCEELAGTKPEQVDALEIERDGVGRIKLVRSAAGPNDWELVEPYRAPADGPAAQAVVSALMSAKPVAHSELSSSPAVHGLAPPGLKVTLRHGPDKASTVSVGDVTIGGARSGVAFVLTSKRPKRPMAVPRGDLDALFREPKGGVRATDIAKWTADYRAKNVFPGDTRAFGEDVTFLKLSLPNKKGQEFALARGPGGWKFEAPAWGDADPDGDPAASATQFTGVLPLLRTLTNLSAATAADFIDAPKDLKEYGLNPDHPDRVRVEMKTKAGQTAVVYIGKYEPALAPVPPKKDGFPPPPPEGGKVYVSIEGTPGVVRCTAGNLAPLVPTVADPSSLRDRDLIRLAPGKSVDGLDLVLAGQPADRPTKVRRVEGGWKLYGGAGVPQPAFGAPVARVIDAVTAKRAVRDFLPPNPANFAAPAATVWVWVDGFNAPTAPAAEPVKRAEPVKLEFGRKEGDGVFVRRTLPDGRVNEFLVPAQVKTGAGTETVDLLATVGKSRLDLLDPALPTFADSAVTKLAVTGAATYTLARDEKPDPLAKEPLWRYTEPAALKGQVADGGGVRDLLGLLATSQSAFGKFVAENPANLAEYGLDKPALKVVVGTGPRPEDERGFEFGKEAGEAGKVYARVIGQPAVFTMQDRALARLKAPDLRDRVLFRALPPAAVTKVELKGWGQLVGNTPVELVLERTKDGAWVATKGPQNFAVDPAKVTAFLELLATARARGFEKGTPEPKHGFGDANQFLQVTVHWPGAALALNVGASPDGGGSYYVWTASLPQTDPVFVVDAPPFKPYKEKPAAFGK